MEGSLTTDHMLAAKHEGSRPTDRWTHSSLAWHDGVPEKRVQVKGRNSSRVPQHSGRGVTGPPPRPAQKRSALAFGQPRSCPLCSSQGQRFLHGLSSLSVVFMMVYAFIFYNHILTNHKWTHRLLFYIVFWNNMANELKNQNSKSLKCLLLHIIRLFQVSSHKS